jgi:RNA polymerase sigma-70 factor (ECF subfamily)
VEESELIHQIKKQNPKAFSLLVDLYSTMVYSVVFKMIGNGQDSEDVTQEVFITIWTTLDSFKGDSLLKTWIYRIAINKTHEFIRKKNRQKRKGFHVQI